MASPLIIGLTGNIATGKSTVMAMLTRLGACGIDADKVVHQLLEGDSDVQRLVVSRFGARVQRPGGTIDRARLGAMVFRDPLALKDLEAILHPRVRVQVERLVSMAEAPVVVVEAIKLFEGGLWRRCDVIWVTTCSQEQQTERLMASRSLGKEEALVRITSQPPQSEKLARADVVIDTSGSLAETEEQITRAWFAAQGLRHRVGARPA